MRRPALTQAVMDGLNSVAVCADLSIEERRGPRGDHEGARVGGQLK